MRRIVCIAAVVVFGLIAVPVARAGQPQFDPDTQQKVDAFSNIVDEITQWSFSQNPDEHAARGEQLNSAFIALTGEAVNPLLGITVLGVYNYWRTDEQYRDYLPAYYQPAVWIPLLIIMALMLFNSTIAEAIPFLKTPLNALGDVVNKAGAIVVLPLAVKMFADTVAGPMYQEVARAHDFLFPAAYAAEGALSSGFWLSGLAWVAGAAVGLIIYLAVWLTFNMVDVLILLCPFPGVDALLKSFRLSVVGALMAAREVSPTFGLILAVIVVVASLFMAGWSFRLSVFGWIVSTDLLFFRHKPVNAGPALAFSGEAVRLPMRTLGRLDKLDDRLVFSYRPWLILPRRALDLGDAPQFAAGRGLLNPFLVAAAAPDSPSLRLPPRYRGQEPTMAAHYGLSGIVDCGTARKLSTWVGSFFRKSPGGAKSN